MSAQQLQAFIEHLKSQDDAQLKQALQAAASAQDLSAVAAVAQQAGFDVEVSDIEDHHARLTANLSDDQLSHLSGGPVLMFGEDNWIIGIGFEEKIGIGKESP